MVAVITLEPPSQMVLSSTARLTIGSATMIAVALLLMTDPQKPIDDAMITL